MSHKSKRDVKKLNRMLGKWGIEIDDPIIGRNKISASAKFEGIEFELTLEKHGKSWEKDFGSVKFEVDSRRLDLEILWEIKDAKRANQSLLEDIKNGKYDRALGMFEDQDFSRFNDYIEDLKGFSNSDITFNGRTFY